MNYYYNILFGVETITNGVKHEPYLCWICNIDIQQEFIGINTCAQDMVNALPTDKKYILLIAHNSDYDCKIILEYSHNVKPIVKSNRFFLKIKATCFNPIHKHKIRIVAKYSYKLIPLPLRDFGECFNLGCHKEVMPYGVPTHQTINMGACCIQDALDTTLKDEDTQQLFK